MSSLLTSLERRRGLLDAVLLGMVHLACGSPGGEAEDDAATGGLGTGGTNLGGTNTGGTTAGGEGE